MNDLRLLPAAFLDRDGVLIRDHGYVYKPEDIEILPGVFEGLKLLRENSYRLILVSNQSGVARGLFTCAQVDVFHQALQSQIQAACGITLDGIYYCPHHPEGQVKSYAVNCRCRKPEPGLLEQAGADFAIDWERSFLVGDKDSDIECAMRAGIRGIQIENDQYVPHQNPHATIASLADIGKLL